MRRVSSVMITMLTPMVTMASEITGAPRSRRMIRRSTRRPTSAAAAMPISSAGRKPSPRPVSPVLAARLGQLQPTGEEAGLGQVVSAEHQVLLDRLHCGQGDVLECPGHPQPGDLVRPQPGELSVTELHTAFGRPVNPGQDVETRRLPGAVGTDDGVNGPGGDGEAHPVQRLDAGEAHSDVAYRQLGYVDAIARLPLGRHPAHRVR